MNMRVRSSYSSWVLQGLSTIVLLASSGLAQDSSVWGKIDIVLTEATAAQAAFGRCRDTNDKLDALPLASTVKACHPTCSVEAVLSDPALKRRIYADIVLRQICLARVLEKPDPCDVLADVPGNPETGQHMCRRLYLMSRFSESLLAGAGVATTSACEAWCHMAPSPPPSNLVKRVCVALSRHDYPQACSDIEQWKSTPDHGYNLTECAWEMQSLLGTGNDEFCGRHYRPGSDVCLATALFKQAKAASDPALCRDQPLCRAMMGEGRAACAVLDARITDQARVLVSDALTPSEAKSIEPKASAQLDQECARTRAKSLRSIDEVRLQLKPSEFRGDHGFAERMNKLSGLEIRQLDLEAACVLRRGAALSHQAVAASSYAGDWRFDKTPKTVTGSCDSSPQNLNKELVHGSIHIDETGHFLYFNHSLSIAGEVNVSGGILSGILTDPYCVEGKISGHCSSHSECSGHYSQSTSTLPGGGGEAGTFRLVR